MKTSGLVHILPILEDNYVYAIVREEEKQAILIDPGLSTPVKQFLKKHDYDLAGIFITHHHSDHTGGAFELKTSYKCPVYAPIYEKAKIPFADHWLKEGDRVSILGFDLSVLHTPGHTLGQIVYWERTQKWLFSGDTLFACGCGRLFEGTAEQMLRSLQMLARLPGDTKVFCAHEYTAKNIEFALSVEPNNPRLLEFQIETSFQKMEGVPTLPSTLNRELDCNPFLRTQSVEIRENLNMLEAKDVEVFAELRHRKDDF